MPLDLDRFSDSYVTADVMFLVSIQKLHASLHLIMYESTTSNAS